MEFCGSGISWPIQYVAPLVKKFTKNKICWGRVDQANSLILEYYKSWYYNGFGYLFVGAWGLHASYVERFFSLFLELGTKCEYRKGRMKKPSVYGSPMEGTLHPGEKFFWRCCFWCSMQISGGPIFQDPCPRSHGWRKKESRWLWYGGKFSGCRLRSAYQLYLSEDHGSWNSEEVLEVLSCGIPKHVTFTARNEKPVRTESYWEERMDRQSFMPRTEEEVDGSSLATSFLTIGDEIWNPSGA